MSENTPPERGKQFSDLFRKEWKLKLPKSHHHWFRTPVKMAKEDFQLENFASLSAFESFSWKRMEGGEEKFYYAVRVGFDEKKENFLSDLGQAEVLVGKNGRVFQAIEKSDIFQPEKRLYLAGLPEEIEMAVVEKSLAEYVEFYKETKKVFYTEQGHFGGKFMIKIKKFLKVPPRQVYLECDDVDLNGLGYTVYSTGFTKETPVAQTPRKCFRCKGAHLVKDCPKKKRIFTWKCTVCGMRSLQCYEGKCAFDQLTEKIRDLTATQIANFPLATRQGKQRDERLGRRLNEIDKHLKDHIDAFKKMRDRQKANLLGTALRRYFNRAHQNYIEKSRKDNKFDIDIFVTEFRDYFNAQSTKLGYCTDADGNRFPEAVTPEADEDM